MDYNATFYIQVYLDGYQIPLMNLESSSLINFKELSHLARGHMSISKGVRQELDGIESVLKGEKEIHSFGGDAWCLVDFKKDTSTVINFYDEFEPFELESNVIYNLLLNWYKFLCTYENGEIPGLIPNIRS